MSKRISRTQTVRTMLALGVAAIGAMSATHARAEEKPFKDVVQLITQPYNGLADVKVTAFDTKTGKTLPDTAMLTDLWLRFWAADGDIAKILADAGTDKPDRDKRMFTVEMFAVVNGRIHADTTGECTGWSENVSWCALGCDGQGFRLKRASTEPYRMSIVIESDIKEDDGKGLPPPRPLSLTLCGANDDGHELLVVPATGRAGEIVIGRE